MLARNSLNSILNCRTEENLTLGRPISNDFFFTTDSVNLDLFLNPITLLPWQAFGMMI